uniref:LEM domain-containing protein n=1 Tax=Ditylenchus dipsaci TaxID=166011 RepID=A0A915CXE8_9BILA
MTKNIPLSNLSDEELRKKLEVYGTNAGPVTPSTRKLYERKLLKLMEDFSGTEQEEFVDSLTDKNTQKLPVKADKTSMCSRCFYWELVE